MKKKKKTVRKAEISGLQQPAEAVVYYYLITMGCSYTQKHVCERTGYSQSTVNDIVKRLLQKHFIIKSFPGQKSNILYSRGKNHLVMDEFVNRNHERILKMTPKKVNGQAVTPPIAGEYMCITRCHMNGGGIYSTVIKEGKIDKFYDGQDPLTGRGVHRSLFGDVEPSKPRGKLQWNGNLLFNGLWFSIVYARSLKKKDPKHVFTIHPPDFAAPGRDLTEKQVYEKFYCLTVPLLRYLERKAGWIFEKDEDGNYKVRVSDDIDYGFDDVTTKAFMELMGGYRGCSGIDPAWCDKSEGAIGPDGEFETNDIDVVHFVANLPSMLDDVKTTKGRVDVLEERTDELDDRLKRLERKKGEEDDE